MSHPLKVGSETAQGFRINWCFFFFFSKARACTLGSMPHGECCCKQWRIRKSDAFLECVPSFPKDVKEQWRKIIHEQGLVLKIGDIHAQTLDRGGGIGRYNFHVALWVFSRPLGTPHLVAWWGAPSHWDNLPRGLLRSRSLPGTRGSTCPRQKQNLPEKNKYKTLL